MSLKLIEDDCLPAGWGTACIGELTDGRGTSVDPYRQPDAVFELYSVPSRERGHPEIVAGREIGSTKQLVSPGDVLISKINPRLNRTWIVGDFSAHTKVASTEWIVFPGSESFDSKFLVYVLQDWRIRDYLAHNVSGVGGSLMRVKVAIFDRIWIGFPPLNEQRRIVAKVEELFSELDAGIESLKKARKQLKVYRQSLLKQAFEGRLTAGWRAENGRELESADELMARLRADREQRYRQRLAQWDEAVREWEENGKDGRKPSKPSKVEEVPPLTPEEIVVLPALPVGWEWLKTGQMFDVFVGATPSRNNATYWGGEIQWVSSGEVAFCRIRHTRERITVAGYQSASTEIHPIGTVLLAMIGEGKTRGQAAILEVDAAHNQNTAAIRVSETECSPEYVYNYLAYRYEMTRRLGSGNNQKALNKDRVSQIPLPLCSTREQREIARILEEKTSVLEQLEQEISDGLSRAESLRQSILKRAFSGQLVPQDSNDEPASVLLERIRAERATHRKSGPHKRKRGG